MTKRVTLTFDVPNSVISKLIPCVRIYAQIHTANGTVEIRDGSEFDNGPDECEGYNATMYAVTIE